jgi:hypothetical protein
MSDRQLIDIPLFNGIDKRHTREITSLSGGKNFWTQGTRLRTRDGTVLVSDAFASPVKSIHSAYKAGLTTRLLVEEGANLWQRLDEGVGWTSILGSITGSGFKSTPWSNPDGNAFLLLGDVAGVKVYNIATGVISDLVNTDDPENVPKFEKMAAFKGKIFGWSPNNPNSHLIRFCGYDTDERVSIDYWPLDFAVDPSGNAGDPVLNCIPTGSMLFIITTLGYCKLYGNSENDFEIMGGASIGGYSMDTSDLVAGSPIWLGRDKKVWRFTGTSADHISEPIDPLLEDESFSNVWAKGFGTQFWLFLPGTTSTIVYVFETQNEKWYRHEYPFVINCGCLFGNYMGVPTAQFGLDDSRVIKSSSSASTDVGTAITTEFILGPIGADGRKLKAKRLKLTAEPKTAFALNVYSKADGLAEQGPVTMTFTPGAGALAGRQITQEAKLSTLNPKGKNLSVRITTTDKVNRLEEGALSIRAGQVK